MQLNKQRSIAFLVHDIHLGGGGERVTTNLANAFKKRGMNVDIVSISEPKSIKPVFELSEGIGVHYLNVNPRSSLSDKWQSVGRLKRFLQNHNYDFVLGMGSHPCIILSLSGTHSYRSVNIGCMHGSFNAMPKIWKIASSFLLKRLDAIVSLTQHDKKILEQIHSDTFVIPNSSTFITEKKAELNNHLLLALGRFSEEKDFTTMIQLFGKFCEVNQNWKLRIRGEGPLKSQLLAQVKESGLSEYIEILPPTAVIENEYLNASVVLLTSKNEGLPMVLIEAQTFGVPVISFDCETGPAEIIQDGVSGYLIDPDKKEALVTRLVELTSNDILRKEMGKNAKQNSERFSEDAIVDKWLGLFQSLTKNK